MPAPTRRPFGSPLLTRRAVASGSLLGVALLVAGAPAAFADDAPTGTDPGGQVQPGAQQPAAQPPLQDVPGPVTVGDGVELGGDFGTGKVFDVYLDPTGDHPADLDLSGVTFTLTDDAGQAHSCTTDVTGDCEFMSENFFGNFPPAFPFGQLPLASVPPDSGDPGGDAEPVPSQLVPDGTYTLSRTGAVTGLDPVVGTLGTVTLSANASGPATDADIPDASLFRTAVTAEVVDSVTGAGVAGASYDLTGPDYPHAHGDGTNELDAGPVTSTTTGALTWGTNWFLPGTWTFTPEQTPAGYQADAAWTTAITTTAEQAADPWTAPAHALVAVIGGAPSTAPAPHPAAPPPAVVPAAPSSRAPITHPSPPPAVQAAAAPTTAEAAPTADVVPTTRPADPQTASPDRVRQAEPKLQTESRTLPESGLIGIGILFVAVVFFAVLLVRRRARRG